MSHFKRRRKARKRSDEDGDPEFQVAPMVDVLLVLMLFFMSITSTEILKNDKHLQLADATHGDRETDRANQITINIGWNYAANTPTGYSIGSDNFTSPNDVEGYLAAKAQANPNAYAVIRADRAVHFSYISDMMTQCAKAGMAKVSFSTLNGGKRTDQSQSQN